MGITLEDLEQHRYLLKEISYLSEKLENITDTHGQVVSDSVIGSSNQFPYQEIVIPIVGVSPKHIGMYHKTKEELNKRITSIKKKVTEIEKFVESVPRSDIRQIIELRYIQGLSWRNVSIKVYGVSAEDRARMAITRYFEKS